MTRVRVWLLRLIAPLWAARRERELAEELEANLQLHIDDYLRAGLTPAEARRRALATFGGLDAAREAWRDQATLPWLAHVAQDLRYAMRWIRKAPAFSATIVATLVLAIGVNTAIFTVLNAVALQSLRTPESQDLAAITLRIEGDRQGRAVHGSPSMLSWPDFVALRDGTPALEGATAFAPFNLVTLGGAEPRQILATVASCEYFDVLRVRAVLGRAFVASDCDRSAPAVVVITDGIWRSAFAADPAIVGRSVSINRTPFTVVGVAPPGISGTQLVAEDVFVPIPAQPALMRGHNLIDNTRASWLTVIGRLRNGASMSALRGELAVIAARAGTADPAGARIHFDAARATLSALPEIHGLVLTVGAVILTGVTLVLLIACANVANLLLARSTARRREFAVRMALGASRARVVRQLLTESLLLAAVGGTIGFVAAQWGTRAIVGFLLANLPQGAWPMVFDPRPDGRVFLYAAGLTTIAGIVFGLVPALRSTRDAALEFRNVTATDARANRRLQQAFVAVQVAVCLVLLIAAGLLLRGLHRAHTIDPGLAMNDVSVVSYDLRGAGYSSDAAGAFQQRVLDRLAALPGVRGVASTSAVPLSDQHQETAFSLDGTGTRRYMEFSQVSASYFDLLGIQVIRGRGFLPAEVESERAAIVTESTARRLWPGADPLTQALTLDGVARPIVGIVRDAQVSRLGQSDQLYVFLPAGPPVQPSSRSSSGVTTRELAALVAGTPATPSARALAEAVRELDPDLAVTVIRLADNLEQWRAPSLIVSSLSAALGLLALVLACTGLFGSVAYSVSRRTREIGIRVALGATHGDVARLIVRQGLRPVAIGMVLGAGGAAAVSAVLRTMLFGLSPHDPWAFVLVPGILALIACVACYLPARRALTIEPTIALRAE